MITSPTPTRIACFGGIYNNYLALESAIADARTRGVDATFCLGDMGAFGPHPDRVFPLLHENDITCIQGNYDDSIGNELDDCQCGYTDPRDNYFAQISYDYTLANTSIANRKFLQQLKPQLQLDLGGKRVLLCHGSPRKVNEFLWESTSSSHFLAQLCEQRGLDAIACTHTGLKWQRHLDHRLFVNVGVLGRPENDGTQHVWYTILSVANGEISAEFVPVEYDYRRLAQEMRDENLPSQFVETVETGWWTTCLEVLPVKERRLGNF